MGFCILSISFQSLEFTVMVEDVHEQTNYFPPTRWIWASIINSLTMASVCNILVKFHFQNLKVFPFQLGKGDRVSILQEWTSGYFRVIVVCVGNPSRRIRPDLMALLNAVFRFLSIPFPSILISTLSTAIMTDMYLKRVS